MGKTCSIVCKTETGADNSEVCTLLGRGKRRGCGAEGGGMGVFSYRVIILSIWVSEETRSCRKSGRRDVEGGRIQAVAAGGCSKLYGRRY